jgi:hypothetical protein
MTSIPQDKGDLSNFGNEEGKLIGYGRVSVKNDQVIISR